MIIGLALTALVVSLVMAPLVRGLGHFGTARHEMVLSAPAGAIGAFVSVLQRMHAPGRARPRLADGSA
jgi:hypothetical protein